MIVEEGALRHLGITNYMYQYRRTNDPFYDQDYYNSNTQEYQQLSKWQQWHRNYEYHVFTIVNWAVGRARYDATTGKFDFTPEKRVNN